MAKQLTRKTGIKITLLLLLIMILMMIDISVGDSSLSTERVWKTLLGRTPDDTVSHQIVFSIRLVRIGVSLLIGAALVLCGVMMQTIFQNPLADPYILGVSSGSSLGVALFVLGAPLIGLSGAAWVTEIGVLGAAWIGSALVLLFITLLSRKINNIFGILIFGVMLSYIVSAIINILTFFSPAERLKLYSLWSMGSLSNVTTDQLLLMTPIIIAGLLLGILCIKGLNLQLLGEEYAETMGLNIKRFRNIIFCTTILLAGTVTAFCGPIGFIGLAVPHVARFIYKTSDHKVIVPCAMLLGSATMLVCDIIAKLVLIPINAVTALMGIPIILWVASKKLRIV